MKRWQGIVSEHCDARVLNDDTMYVKNASYKPETKETFDNYINYDKDIKAYIVDTVKQDDKFEIVEITIYKSIYDYLGY